MGDGTENCAFWLMPTLEAGRFFESLIADLARRFDAPFFEPHLTLESGSVAPQEALDVLRSVPAGSSYKLDVESVETSDVFTRTLALRFRPSADLCQLRAAIARALRMETVEPFQPHLSLLYREMPSQKRIELPRLIAIPWERVTFDRLKLITHPARIESREDVEAWQVLGERRL